MSRTLRLESAIDTVQSQSALEQVANALVDATIVYFDTEFLREKTYYPQLCLMQLRVDETTYLVDPLLELDFDAFWDALLATRLVLHSGRQDLEVLMMGAGRLPEEVFDTQVAGGIVGLPPQIGYAKLVEAICNVTLAKAHTRTNWSRRPLATDVLQYAADDVNYLPAIYGHLQEKLTELGREDWATSDCADMLSPALYENPTDNAWQRVKGFGNLPQKVQPLVMALCQWREEIAQKADRPRQWILRDASLLDIAFGEITKPGDIGDIQGISSKFANRYANKVFEVINGDLPVAPEYRPRPDDVERRKVKAMAAAVREIAQRLEMEAEILAPQRELRDAIRGNEDIRAFRGWRAPLIEKTLREIIAGD
ncbi:MAG: ribonuclease D [Woeseiaceae bacterium]